MAQIHATADQSGQRTVAEGDTLKNGRPSTPPVPKRNPPLSGEGLELIRSSHC